MSNETTADAGDYGWVWWWRKLLPERKGQACRVLARGRLNTCLIEFPDGLRVVTSRYAVRRRAALQEAADLQLDVGE